MMIDGSEGDLMVVVCLLLREGGVEANGTTPKGSKYPLFTLFWEIPRIMKSTASDLTWIRCRFPSRPLAWATEGP